MADELAIVEIEPIQEKRGPLVMLEWDAYADVDGIRFWRLKEGLDSWGKPREERWYFAEERVSVSVAHYPERGAIESFTGWRVSGYAGGSGNTKFASREDALRAAVVVVRERTREQADRAWREYNRAEMLLARVTRAGASDA